MRIKVFQSLILFLFFAPLVFGETAPKREYFLPSPTKQKYVVILGGAAADKKHADLFREWALKLHDALIGEYGYGRDQIRVLLGEGDPEEARISGPCRKETIGGVFKDLQKVVRPGDQLFLFLLGHGTSDGEVAKFNIVGPDITGENLHSLLNDFSEQDIMLVNTTSSSYPFCMALSGPGRVILSATRSSAEKYDTRFPQFFLEALENHAGDRDKNRRLSMWEAFIYARKSVEQWYTDNDRLPIEHAVLDDNGDRLFHARPNPLKDDGRLAQIAYFDHLSSFHEVDTDEGANLTSKLQKIERSIFMLRNRKAELTKNDYQKQMEAFLIEFARINKKLRTITREPK